MSMRQEQQEQSSQQTAAFKAPPDQFELNEALAISMAKVLMISYTE